MDQADSDTVEILEELTELLEINSRNSFNLCRTGAFQKIIDKAVRSSEKSIRMKCFQFLTSLMSNDFNVQEFAVKSGTLQLI